MMLTSNRGLGRVRVDLSSRVSSPKPIYQLRSEKRATTNGRGSSARYLLSDLLCGLVPRQGRRRQCRGDGGREVSTYNAGFQAVNNF